MTVYTNFIGIDIGKFSFTVSLNGKGNVQEYMNTPLGIKKFIKDNATVLKNSLSIAETTGGYELKLLDALLNNGHQVHRADTRKVKSFIRSYGNTAKTDKLDSHALARYGIERAQYLKIYTKSSTQYIKLQQLVQRRSDLKAVLIAEKNRLQAPTNHTVKDNIKVMVDFIAKQIESINSQIISLIESDEELKDKKNILKTIAGIGDIVAFELLILLPELGKISRREIASLAGVAPRANDSGKYSGYRRTGKGRNGVKATLFIAAIAARNSKTALRAFYEKLTEQGKKKMVALTALMRKIIVIANAKLKKYQITKHS